MTSSWHQQKCFSIDSNFRFKFSSQRQLSDPSQNSIFKSSFYFCFAAVACRHNEPFWQNLPVRWWLYALFVAGASLMLQMSPYSGCYCCLVPPATTWLTPFHNCCHGFLTYTRRLRIGLARQALGLNQFQKVDLLLVHRPVVVVVVADDGHWWWHVQIYPAIVWS